MSKSSLKTLQNIQTQNSTNESKKRKEELIRLLEEKARRECVRRYPEFIKSFSPEPPPEKHHLYLIDKLEQVAAGLIRRLMVFMPPGHAKSTYSSYLFPAWFVGHFKVKNIICATYAQDLSDIFGRRVRNLVGSPKYREVFEFGLSKDSRSVSKWSVEQGGQYYAVGVDTGVTGRRGDLGIIDDPIKGRKEADSDVFREHLWNWYLTEFRTRLKPLAPIVLIQTRWHEDDLAGRILPESYRGESGKITANDGEVWDVVCFPALAEENDVLGRKPGDALWPEFFTKEMLEQEKITQTERGWSALFQQVPTPQTGNYFKRKWVKYYEPKDLPDSLIYYGASDYAVTDGGGDFTVHGVIGLDCNDDIWVVDWWREQTDSMVWIESMLDMVRRWNPRQWGEEKGQIAKSVGPFLEKRMTEKRAYVFREQFPVAKDKPTRAQAFRGRMSQGKVHFPNNPWGKDIVRELMSFPAGKNDDQIDVLSIFGTMLSKMTGKKLNPMKKRRANIYQSEKSRRDAWMMG